MWWPERVGKALVEVPPGPHDQEAPGRAEGGRQVCTDFYCPMSLAGHDPKHQAPIGNPEQQPLGRQMTCVSSPRHRESLDLLNSKMFPHWNVSETRMCLTTDVGNKLRGTCFPFFAQVALSLTKGVCSSDYTSGGEPRS